MPILRQGLQARDEWTAAGNGEEIIPGQSIDIDHIDHSMLASGNHLLLDEMGSVTTRPTYPLRIRPP